MKIGIEGQRLFRKKKHGMDMVALELIRHLQKVDRENEYVIFVKPDEDNTCIPEASNFKVVELNGGPYPVWEQFALPRAAKAEGCDLLHCTSNTGPVRSKVPLILTLHDIIFLESVSLFNKAGTWYQKLGNMYRRWIVPTVVKNSKCVVTVSDYERMRIEKFMGLEDKLMAVYNGVGKHFKKIDDQNLLGYIKEKYHLPEKFFFFLGNTDPKKNTANVLKAFARFNERNDEKYSLVMLDYEESALRRILTDIGHPEIREKIHLTGYVVNTDLPAIINQCRLFLYPSLRESFGIPILEGMACGVPVITSNISSMPEIAGDAALLIDPNVPDEITQAMLRLVSDMDMREQLIGKGLNRAKAFSWENMALNYLEHYKRVVTKSTGEDYEK